MHHACARGELSRLPKDIKVGFYVSIASAQELGALDAHLSLMGSSGLGLDFHQHARRGISRRMEYKARREEGRSGALS